jgi:hypothetical protein
MAVSAKKVTVEPVENLVAYKLGQNILDCYLR